MKLLTPHAACRRDARTTTTDTLSSELADVLAAVACLQGDAVWPHSQDVADWSGRGLRQTEGLIRQGIALGLLQPMRAGSPRFVCLTQTGVKAISL